LVWLLWWFFGVAPQPVQGQRSQDHGQVGAAHAHLAAEQQGGQTPGRVPGQAQAGGLLGGDNNTRTEDIMVVKEEQEEEREVVEEEEGAIHRLKGRLFDHRVGC